MSNIAHAAPTLTRRRAAISAPDRLADNISIAQIADITTYGPRQKPLHSENSSRVLAYKLAEDKWFAMLMAENVGIGRG